MNRPRTRAAENFRYMRELLTSLMPEMLLAAAALALFLLGCGRRPAYRAAAPWIALAVIVAALLLHPLPVVDTAGDAPRPVRIDMPAFYLRVLSLLLSAVLLLLFWPTRADRTGNSAVSYGEDAGEFFGLFLLSLAGLLLATTANDLIVLLLALELAAIPTYIMIAVSRRVTVAQEAALKYFFLGALSAAMMLLGFSYLYGIAGTTNLQQISAAIRRGLSDASAPALNPLQHAGVVLVVLSLAFKMAAFPFHFYVGDVYEGAATPVGAFLAYVPKVAGLAVLLRIAGVVGGPGFAVTPAMNKLLWIMAVATMTIGNVLALLQSNVKRVLGYSSMAHSGYMLAGVAAMLVPGSAPGALAGVLFYVAAYGLMSVAAFAVLMELPGRWRPDGAETFDDIAGAGREHVALGLAMAVCCLGLTGIPLTVGFLGKFLLIKPALGGGLVWLALILVVNSAISACYYLRIVAAMFLPPDGPVRAEAPSPAAGQTPVLVAIILSVAGTIALGSIPQAARALINDAWSAVEQRTVETHWAAK